MHQGCLRCGRLRVVLDLDLPQICHADATLELVAQPEPGPTATSMKMSPDSRNSPSRTVASWPVTESRAVAVTSLAIVSIRWAGASSAVGTETGSGTVVGITHHPMREACQQVLQEPEGPLLPRSRSLGSSIGDRGRHQCLPTVNVRPDLGPLL